MEEYPRQQLKEIIVKLTNVFFSIKTLPQTVQEICTISTPRDESVGFKGFQIQTFAYDVAIAEFLI